jgi:hypothetical protein
MSDPQVSGGDRPRPGRFRLTIGTLMGLILALSAPILLISPVFRHGVPPCLSAGRTATWLLCRPGQASCASCHDLVSSAALVQQQAQPLPLGSAPCEAGARAMLSAGQPQSCVQCHSR